MGDFFRLNLFDLSLSLYFCTTEVKSTLQKYEDGQWRDDPPSGIVYGGEVLYVKGDETIEAAAAQDGCRIVLFYDAKNKKAAIAHLDRMTDEDQYTDLIKPINKKRFNSEATIVYLCGDEGTDEYSAWNDEIETYISQMGFNVKRISQGRGKDVFVNPGRNEIKISDSKGNILCAGVVVT
ncbi:MAG: hypothetical protein ACOYXT_21935 [Bacteroidota bacterium]